MGIVKRMGANGHGPGRRRFSWPVIAEKWLAFTGGWPEGPGRPP